VNVSLPQPHKISLQGEVYINLYIIIRSYLLVDMRSPTILIPKEFGTNEIGKFRPIALANFKYKIIS